jgi:aspartate dehydrogenase
MNKVKCKKIGIIGFGQIGASIHEQIQGDPSMGLEIVFIHETDMQRAADVPKELRLTVMEDSADRGADLVVEAAHPDAVRRYGSWVLGRTDLMIMSVSAMGDPDLEASLKQACRDHGTRLYIPHGATLGLDGLKDGLSIWEEVSITMRKNPRNLNFKAAPHLRPGRDDAETIIYDGPTRGILPLFPKNVNSHATLALATLGFDRTRSILVSDPGLEESVIEIEARGGGTLIVISRRNPIKGVTGKLTILSVLESIKNVLGQEDVIRVC